MKTREGGRNAFKQLFVVNLLPESERGSVEATGEGRRIFFLQILTLYFCYTHTQTHTHTHSYSHTLTKHTCVSFKFSLFLSRNVTDNTQVWSHTMTYSTKVIFNICFASWGQCQQLFRSFCPQYYGAFCATHMGVRRLFSRGGQNFPGGGPKTYYLPKKRWKRYYFPQKKSKNILFRPARGGGQGPPLALTCGRPCISVTTWILIFKTFTIMS